MVAVEDHVHALEDEALVVILEREDAFAAQDVRAFLLHQVLHPGKELVGIERLVALERNRLHVLVVIVLQPAVVRVLVPVVMIMMMVVIMAVPVMMVVIVLVLLCEELRLDVEDAVEVEGVAVEHFAERDLGALGLVHAWRRD